MMKPLTKLSQGEKAFIVDMRDEELCKTLFELGVFPGDLLEVKENQIDTNSVIVRVNNRTLNLFRNSAETIITNIVSFEFNLN
jgi:Fe2+ transport system protein FeoA